MATKKAPAKSDDKSRPIMDMGSATPTFMHEQADLDKQDAVTATLDKAIAKIKESAAAMVKAITHAQATEGDDMKMACLDEVATTGNNIRDKARAAIRAAKKSQAAAKPAKKGAAAK